MLLMLVSTCLNFESRGLLCSSRWSCRGSCRELGRVDADADRDWPVVYFDSDQKLLIGADAYDAWVVGAFVQKPVELMLAMLAC